MKVWGWMTLALNSLHMAGRGTKQFSLLVGKYIERYRSTHEGAFLGFACVGVTGLHLRLSKGNICYLGVER